MAALRQGEFVPPPDDSYDPQADMKAIRGAHKRKPVEQDSYLNKEQLLELRKVQNERIEVRCSLTFSVRPGNMSTIGREDETAWNGDQAEYGCAHGWDYVR
jgi:hypothetical protein